MYQQTSAIGGQLSMDPIPKIADLARACSRQLAHWVDAAIPGSEAYEQALRLSFRFNLWAQNNAAFSYRVDSMDQRLRKARMAHSVITDLLEDLACRLENATEHTSVSSLSDPSAEDDIDVILDQLFRFSRAIRRSGISQRFARLSQYVEGDIDGQAEALSNEFEKLVDKYLKKKIEDGTYTALETSPLQERLLRSICLRQQYFNHLTWQRGSITIPQQPRDNHASRRSRMGPSGTVYSISNATETTSRTTSGTRLGKMIRATTVATNARPVTTEIHRGPYKEDFETDFPPRPIASDRDIKDLECPYCYLVYPVHEFSAENWPKHVVADLMPFICIATTCPKPRELYKTMESWVSHLNKEHAQDLWTCMHSNHPSPMDFFSEDGIVAHLLNDHGDDVTEEVAREIADDCHARISFVDSLDNCPLCDDAGFDNTQKILEHIADHLVWLSQISLSAHEIPEGFEMDYASESGKESQTHSIRSGNIFITRSPSRDEHMPIESRTEEPSHYVNEVAPDLSPENMHTWQELTAHPATKTNYDPANDKVLLRMRSFQPSDREDAHAVPALEVSSQTASSVDAIKDKVNRLLYSKTTAIPFRTLQNHLVECGILTDKQLEQHHNLINGLFYEWQTVCQAQHSEHHQRLPMSPQTPESLAPQAVPPETFASSPSEDARAATAVEMLKEAVAAIDPNGPLQDGATTSLFLPGDTAHRSVPVTRMESLSPQSYIRARTLETNNIEWEGEEIVLRWKSWAITRDRDQSVQRTCFHVVDETMASQAGFRFDILVGVDHGHPLLEQMQALAAEETSSVSPSSIDQTEDLSARTVEDSRSSELSPMSAAYRGPKTATPTLSFSGSPREVASFINEIQEGTDVAIKGVESPAENFIES